MRRRFALTALALAGLGGALLLGSQACGDGTGPDSNACQSLHFSSDGRSLWGNCCGGSAQLLDNGVLAATTTCHDDEGCSGSWSVTGTRESSTGRIASYTAVYNNSTTCRYP